MKYISDDGKLFSTEKECKDHEKAVKLQKKMSETARETNFNKIKEVFDTYNDLIEEGDKLTDQAEDYYEKADDLLDHCTDLITQYNDMYEDSQIVMMFDEEEENIYLQECNGDCDNCEMHDC